MKKLCIAALSAYMLSGCASMFTGQNDDIMVSTTQDPAQCEVKGMNAQKIINTPTTVIIPRSLQESATFDCKADGYDGFAELAPSFNPVALLSVISIIPLAIVGVPATIVDGASGAMGNYDESIVIDMQPTTDSQDSEVKNQVSYLDPNLSQ